MKYTTVQMRPLSELAECALERRPSRRRWIKAKEFSNSDVPRLRNRHFNFGHLPERSGKRTCLRNLQKTPQNGRIWVVEARTRGFWRVLNLIMQRKLGVKNAVWPKMAKNGRKWPLGHFRPIDTGFSLHNQVQRPPKCPTTRFNYLNTPILRGFKWILNFSFYFCR